MTCNKSKEIKLGTKIEMEHHLGKSMATKIANDHIKENKCYYSKFLIPMEKKMNKRGQVIFYNLMLAVVFFMMGLGLAKPLIDIGTENMAQLDCSNTSISNDYKATCTALDIFAPMFVALIFGLCGWLLGGIVIR